MSNSSPESNKYQPAQDKSKKDPKKISETKNIPSGSESGLQTLDKVQGMSVEEGGDKKINDPNRPIIQ
jgi:hypothetical protein